MKKLTKREKILNKLYELFNDLGDWLPYFLEQNARDGPKSIWGELNTRELIKLNEKYLREFLTLLEFAKNKNRNAQSEQLKVYREFGQKAELSLEYLRKEFI